MTEETSSLAAWESQKENVEPLRKGRHAKSLHNALEPTGKSLAALKEERRQFENEILAEDDSQDPLSTWDRYLKWTDQNFPVGGNKEDYLNLLYRIVQKFWDNDQYKNDERLIRVCLLYATMQQHDRALQVFYNLYRQQVGVKSPELYKLWVEEYEKTSNMKEANKVFKRAQTYLGECNEELNKIRKEFDFRCGREIQKKMKEEMENGLQATIRSRDKERKTLGKLRTVGEKKKVGSVRPKTQGTIRVRQRDDVLTQPPNKSNGRLQVFADDNSGDDDDNYIINSSSSLKAPSHHRNVDKENFMGEPSLWKGKRVKQSYHRAPAPSTDEFLPIAVAPQPQSFAIFTEEEEDDEKPSTSTVWNTEVLQLRKTCQVDSKTANILLGDSKDLFSQSSQTHEKNPLQIDGKNKSSIYMFPVDKVYSEMGEFQLEEIFYAQWSRQQKIIAQKKKEQQEQEHLEGERERERKELIQRRDEQIKLLYEQMCDEDDDVKKEEEEEKNKELFIEKKESDGIKKATGDYDQVIEKDLLDLLGVEQPGNH